MNPVVFFIDLDPLPVVERGEAWSQIAQALLAQEGLASVGPPVWVMPGWWRAGRFDGLREAMATHLSDAAGAPAAVVLKGQLTCTMPLWSEVSRPKAFVLVLEFPDGKPTPAQVLAYAAALGPAYEMDRGLPVLVVDRARLRSEPEERSRVERWLAEVASGANLRGQIDAMSGPAVPLLPTDLGAVVSGPAYQELSAALASAASSEQVFVHREGRERRVLLEARLAFEGALLDEGFARQRRMGAAMAALADVERQLVLLHEDHQAKHRQLQVVTREVGDLRDRLRTQLGTWCSLDELGEKGEKIRDLVRHMQAVRASWTYRFALFLGWPLRVVHGVWMRVRGARSQR